MKNKKIIAILVVLIILVGIIMVFTKGFNKDISYQKATRIEVSIPKGYEKDDIKQIAEEVFSDKNIQMQDIEKTNQVVSVRIKDYTEEELNNFKTIISEKYGIEQDKLTVEEVKIPGTKMLTLVTPYLFSLGLVTVLTIIYICLKNIKKEPLKKVLKTIFGLIASVGLYFSIIAIARIPVNEYTMPLALTVYVAALLITVEKINKE